VFSYFSTTPHTPPPPPPPPPAAASENLLRIKFFDQFTVALIDYFSLDL
jgi:hypothetical protein